jgi:predicted enzyme related to lactoylglutathione lyase
MRRAAVSACFASLVLAAAHVPLLARAQASQPALIVFFDIAGPQSANLASFYSTLFGWNAGADGNLSIPVVPPLGGSLRSGDATEKRIYIGVDDVAAKLAEVAANGGTIDAPRFEVPGVVVLGLFKDPAGNPMGLVEMQNGKAKVP